MSNIKFDGAVGELARGRIVTLKGKLSTLAKQPTLNAAEMNGIHAEIKVLEKQVLQAEIAALEAALSERRARLGET